MRTTIAGPLADTIAGATAEAVLKSCVHCGMCNATCPTFKLTGDELDGPRGRIYLMKSALEGEAVTRTTQLHLDRCLVCRACETTCPSGVEYHRLLDVARPFVDAQLKPAVAGARFALGDPLGGDGSGPASGGDPAWASRPAAPICCRERSRRKSMR